MLYDAVNCTFEIQLYGLIITFVNYKLVYNDVQKLFENEQKCKSLEIQILGPKTGQKGI